MKKIVFLLLLLLNCLASEIGFNGDYWVITYYKGKLEFDLWRSLGINAAMIYQQEDDLKVFQAGFPFYNEYVLPQIGWDSKIAGMYEFICRKYFGDGDKTRLIRKPCLNDPEYWETSKKRIQDLVKKRMSHNPLAYSLGDECSVTSYVKPFDFCFSDFCLSGMREWLKKEYGSLEELNKEWETSFKSWEEVRPFTTDEAKERQNKGNENFSPWADHRTWMEMSFANFLDKCRKYSEEIDPKTPVGLSGCQMPSCFGGYDWWRLCKVINFIEAYDIGNNIELIRSFVDNKKVFTCFTTSSENERSKWTQWYRLFHGDRGTIIYDGSMEKGGSEYKVAKGLKDTFIELNKGISKKLLSASLENDPVAIHYSHPTIHAQWMLETGPDKNRNWVTWSERQSSRLVRSRDGWCKLIEDLGLQYKFVSYEQVENGELIKSNYKVFIMPQSTAISPKEAKAIEEFVNNGGILIGDCQIATMDQHCKRLKEGQLDKLFGIKRSNFIAEETNEEIVLNQKKLNFKGAEPGIYISDTSAKALGYAGNTPIVIMRNVGKGKTVYLNFYLSGYPKNRLQPGREKPMRDVINKILVDFGIKSRVKLLDTSGNEISGFRVFWYRVSEKEEYLAIIKNTAAIQNELGETKELIKAGGKILIKVVLPNKGKVSDLRTGKEIGITDSINAEFDPYEPNIYDIVWQ